MAILKNQTSRYSTLQWGMGVAGVALALLVYLAGIRPARLALAATQVKRAKQSQLLAANQSEAAKLPAMKLEVAKLRSQLDGLDKKLPKRPDTDQFGREITHVSAQCELKKVNMQVGAARRSELFSEMPISLNFTGEFSAVMAFLRQTEEMQRLTRVRSLAIKTRDANAGTVDVEVAMNIYFADE